MKNTCSIWRKMEASPLCDNENTVVNVKCLYFAAGVYYPASKIAGDVKEICTTTLN
jgi:hypothetical protein